MQLNLNIQLHKPQLAPSMGSNFFLPFPQGKSATIPPAYGANFRNVSSGSEVRDAEEKVGSAPISKTTNSFNYFNQLIRIRCMTLTWFEVTD